MLNNLTESLLGNKTDKLHSNSKNILDIFTSTVEDLTNLNKEIEARELEQFEVKKKLEDELSKLAYMKENHSKVISKINKIFE